MRITNPLESFFLEFSFFLGPLTSLNKPLNDKVSPVILNLCRGKKVRLML